MQHRIKIGDNQEVLLEHGSFEDIVNVDDLTTVDSSNLYGEHVTVSAAVNRVGLLRASVKRTVDYAKMALKIYEANYKKGLRAQAYNNAGKYKVRVGNQDIEVKLTEKGLDTCFEHEDEWKALKMEFIEAEHNWDSLDVLYWASQDKSKKIGGLFQGTTPEEYVSQIVEGRVNGILIKK